MLRKQYEAEGHFVGVQTKFNYAWGLIKSDKRVEQQLGVRLLTGTRPHQHWRLWLREMCLTIVDIFKDYPERRRECVYYLALGHYRLGNYAEARQYNEILLGREPGNLQAQSLKGLIDDKVARGTNMSQRYEESSWEMANEFYRGTTGSRHY